MPELADIQPAFPGLPKDEQQAADARRAAIRTPSFLDTAASAFTETYANTIGRQVARYTDPVDPNFRMTPDLWDGLTADIPTDQLRAFDGATSLEGATRIREQQLDIARSRSVLQDSGWTGRGAAIFAGLTDPLALVALVGSGGGAGELVAGGTAARLAAMAKAGMAVAVPMAGLEAYKATQDQRVGVMDIAESAATGFGFGAGQSAGQALGRIGRFLTTGVGQATPQAIFDASRSDRSLNDAIYGSMFSFLTAGAIAQIHGPEDAAISDAAARVKKEIEWNDLSRTPGVAPSEQAKAYYADVASEEAINKSVTDRVSHLDLGSEQTKVGEPMDSPTPEVVSPQEASTNASRGVEVMDRDRNSVQVNRGEGPEKVTATAALDEDGQYRVKHFKFTKDTGSYDQVDVPLEELKGFQTASAAVRYALNMVEDRFGSPSEPSESPVPRGTLQHPEIAAEAAPKPEGEAKPAEPAPLTRGDKINAFADQLEANAKARMAARVIPRGPNVGAGINPVEELRDIAALAVAKSLRGGVIVGAQLGQIVQQLIQEHVPHLMHRWNDALDMTHALLSKSIDEDLYASGGSPPKDAGPVRVPPAREPGMFDLSKTSDAPAAFAKTLRAGRLQIPLRPGMYGQLAEGQQVPEMRLWATMWGNDPIMKADGTAANNPAGMARRAMASRSNMEWTQGTDEPFSKWKEGKDYRPLIDNAKARRDFMEEVGKATRRNPGDYTDDPNVNAVSDLFRKRRQENLEMKQKYGVPGYDIVQPNQNYVQRIMTAGKYNKLVAEVGADNVHDLIGESYGRGDAELNRIVGEGYAHVTIKSRLGQDTSEEFRQMSPTDIAKELKDALPNATPAQIEQAVYKITAPRSTPGPVASSMRRSPMDETYSKTVTDVNGNPRKISIEDLLENNADYLDRQASSGAIRASLTAEAIRSYNVRKGLTPYGEFDGALTGFRTVEEVEQDIKEAAQANAKTPSDQAVVNSNMQKLGVLRTLSQGMSVPTNHPLAADVARTLQAVQVLRLMGNTGLKHAANFGAAVQAAGFRSILNQLPALGKILTPFAEGMRMSDPLIAEGERIVSAQSNPRFNETFARGTPDADVDQTNSAWLGGWMRRGIKTENVLNGLSYMSRALSESNAVLQEQRWLNWASSGKLPSEATLGLMGLDASSDMPGRIAQMIRDHSESVPSAIGLGRSLKVMNVNSWADQDAATAYTNAIVKTVNRLMNASDPGQLPMSATGPWGSLLWQMKKWPLTAYENMILHGVQQDKLPTMIQFMMMTTLGAAAYTTSQYLRSIGRDDRDAFLKDKLSAANIAKGAFQYGGYALYTPEAADIGAAAMGVKNLPFSGRSYNGEGPLERSMGGAIVDSNPTFAWLHKDGPHALDAAIKTGFGLRRPVKQNDLNAFAQAAPFGNTYLLKTGINAVGARR